MPSSLTFKNRQFFLKEEPFRIFSGAIHYFRVLPECWQDRLLKAKACGLNTIETYLAWNLHEPRPGVFKNDGLLDFRRFIQMAADLGLYVILRPGPYICSEWDFGGLPSWLLADPGMKVRSNYQGYIQPAERFLTWVLAQVVDLQHSAGGPIIAVQVENEFGSYSREPDHLTFIKDVLVRNGVTELLVTSDSESDARTAPYIDGVLPTANFQTADNGQVVFDTITKTHKDYPLMVMEFWTGWFDYWGGRHEGRSVELLEETLKFCFESNASVNFYMFFGGTNFGFMSGALQLSSYKPDITSYDYSAPLAEDGSVTEKYLKIKDMIQKERVKLGTASVELPPVPQSRNKITKRRLIPLQQTMSWSDLIGLVMKTTSSTDPKYMEMYEFPNNEIQSYGYIVYQRFVNKSGSSELELPPVKDHANILIDGCTSAVIDWKEDKPTASLQLSDHEQALLDIVVENLGRVNYTSQENPERLNTQRKGVDGHIKFGGQILQGWKVIALDFCEEFLTAATSSNKWKPFTPNTPEVKVGPALYRANLQVSDSSPGLDAFIRLEGFVKGIVIVNGFNLGRYWNKGPQHTLYLPGPLLKQGDNDVLIFEESRAANEISLEIEPILG